MSLVIALRDENCDSVKLFVWQLSDGL